MPKTKSIFSWNNVFDKPTIKRGPFIKNSGFEKEDYEHFGKKYIDIFFILINKHGEKFINNFDPLLFGNNIHKSRLKTKFKNLFNQEKINPKYLKSNQQNLNESTDFTHPQILTKLRYELEHYSIEKNILQKKLKNCNDVSTFVIILQIEKMLKHK